MGKQVKIISKGSARQAVEPGVRLSKESLEESIPRITKSKQRRVEKKVASRRAINRAAIEVIGKYGYEKASIALITKCAKLGLGSFYLHFHSRQDLFDQLLPQLGIELQHFVADRVRGAKDFYEVDKRGLKAFFEFVKLNPGFFRVLSEAEAATPRGFQAYKAIMLQRYVVSLERGRAAGDIVGFTGRDLVLVAYMLMAARLYIHVGFEKTEFGSLGLPEWIVETYARFIRHGLSGGMESNSLSVFSPGASSSLRGTEPVNRESGRVRATRPIFRK